MSRDLRDWDVVSGVGMTALVVAAARAVETNRAEGLVRDPFAEVLVEAANPPVRMLTRLSTGVEPTSKFDQRWDKMATYLGVRSKFFDEYLMACGVVGVRQSVLLAVGLDTRAFRLDWPAGFRLFEVDQPRVLSFKDAVLERHGAQPRCARTVVAVDLRDNWASALLSAGFDASQPTAWLAEGLLNYLPSEAQRQLLDAIHRLSAPGSQLAIEQIADPATALERAQSSASQFGIEPHGLFEADSGDDPESYLSSEGWEVSSVSGTELIERYRPQRRHTPQTLARSTYYYSARLL